MFGRAVNSDWGGALMLALLAAGIIACRALALLYDHSLHSIDGVLQTWFALDNFADGAQLGSDFQSYLGVTMILALLPIYVVSGETLYASTLAATIAVVLGAFGSTYAASWFMSDLPPALRWAVAILLVCAFYFVLAAIAEAVGYRYPLSFDPGVSLRPVRGLLPFLALPFYAVALRRVLETGRSIWGGVLGLFAGAGVLWSNDAGIPLIIATSGALVLALCRQPVLLGRTLAWFAGVGGACAVAIIMLATHGEPMGWLTYNFVHVAGDQFWYFAPWDRSTRILGPADLRFVWHHASPLSLLSLTALIACVLFQSVQLVRGRASRLRGSAFVMVGASLIGTALIPQVGGHVEDSYNHIAIVFGLLAPLIVLQHPLQRATKPLLRHASPAVLFGAALLAACVMLGAEGARAHAIVKASDRSLFERELGFYVTRDFAEDLAAMRQLAMHWDSEGVPRDRRLLSVYTSALDIAAGTQSPSAVGSLIHALGDANRSDFTALVTQQKVAAVTTIAPGYSGWEGWIVRANWPFMRALLDGYRPIAANDQHVLWVRAPQEYAQGATRTDAATCTIERVSASVLDLVINAQGTGFASVALNRDEPFAGTRGAMLTVVETSPFTKGAVEPAWNDFPRYGVANRESLLLGVPVEPDAPSRLRLEILDGSPLGDATCTAELVHRPDLAPLPALPAGVAAYLAGMR